MQYLSIYARGFSRVLCHYVRHAFISNLPISVINSTSIVGLPLESKISLALAACILEFLFTVGVTSLKKREGYDLFKGLM